MEKHTINLMDPKHSTVSLIANSGIQCLDYLIDTSALRQTEDLRFYHYSTLLRESKQEKVHGLYLHPVTPHELEEDEEPPAPEDQLYRSRIDSSIRDLEFEETYKATVKRALQAFDRQWIPVPIFRVLTNSSKIEEGPTNWARIYLASPEKEGDPYRIVIGFDTEICNKMENRPYAGPEASDASPVIRFQLAKDLFSICNYSVGSWQQDWLKDAFIKGMSKSLPGQSGRKYVPKKEGEPWAHYISLIYALNQLTTVPSIKLIKATTESNEKMKPQEQRERFVDVDMVLDVGNSRTCGLLAEFGAGRERTGLGAQPPTLLRIRQLARPELVSEEPFESRIEFHPPQFGMTNHGRKSGRPSGKDAFWWPSPLRVGNEAVWLATQTDGRKGISGMSSPKRYVWDKQKRPRVWINNETCKFLDGRIPPIISPISSKLKEDGQIKGLKEQIRKIQFPYYSRGSIYMLLLCEVLCHAIAQINSAAYRYQRSDTDLPRRLRKIILTLPSATPLTERKRMKDYANKAIRLVWQSYGWDKDDLLHPKPTLTFEWDEATCTQLVFLYNELEHRFQEFPKAFFELYGKGRKGEFGAALRVASIDIGGGTTDLMIIDHELHDQLIIPNQRFREGVRVAGDDIVKDIIQKIVLPTFVDSIRAWGERNAEHIISYLFGGDQVDTTHEDQTRRTLFVNRILVPAAVRLLQEYEDSVNKLTEEFVEFSLLDIIDHTAVTDDILEYVSAAISKNENGEAYDPLITKVVMQPGQMAGAAEAVLGGVLRDFCDVIRAYRCDILLISGRPVAMPAIRDIILAGTPLSGDRIISMYGYEVGHWYPYRSTDFRIWDPKTTASVGAMLCHLCEGDYAHFSFDTISLKAKSTARYIGRMSNKGQVSQEDVFFENTAEDDSAFRDFTANMTAKLDIGYRQLPYERWATSQIWSVHFKNPDMARSILKPIRLKLKRNEAFDDDVDQEQAKEDFEIVEAFDRNGEPIDTDNLSWRLQTFFGAVDQVEAGYWLDSGVLSTVDLIEGDY